MKEDLADPSVLDASVLIVGAGPYGIAVAQELWHRGLEPVVVGEPFNTWHQHTLDIMDLRSDPRGSSVWSPDGRYDFPSFLHQASSGGGHGTGQKGTGQEGAGQEKDQAEVDSVEEDPVEKDQVPVSLYRGYLHQVEDSLPFRLVHGLVQELDMPEPGRFTARARSGELDVHITARLVIVATGLGGHQYLPPAFEALPAGRLLHSWDVEEIQRLDGRRVLVVGGGQSAAETVAALRGRNQVTWALKRPPLFFREPLRVPTPLFKLMLAGSSWIFRLPPPILRLISRAAFRTTITPRLTPVWRDPQVEKLITNADGLGLTAPSNGNGNGTAPDQPGAIHCAADGRRYDAVVSATGYRFSLAGLPFLSPELAARLRETGDPPQIGSDFQSGLPGLYFVGGIAESTHGPAMRFVLGARHAAKTLGRSLPAKLAKTPKAETGGRPFRPTGSPEAGAPPAA